ncbi:MAG: universal stress protein [Acidobacteria bacterium]|nr:universal stress protein [Acidobacteriota bacterium]
MRSKKAKGSLKPIQSVLVATDLSVQSQCPVSRAARLPLAPDATVTLLHVLPGGMTRDTRKEAEKQASEMLARQASIVSKSGRRAEKIQWDVNSELAMGTPWETIIRRARSARAELVVMGGRSHKRFGDIFLGSTASRVIRQGNLPVLIVNQLPAAPYGRPLVAVDLEEDSPKVLEMALQLLQDAVPCAWVLHSYGVPFEGFIFPTLSHKQRAEYREDARKNARLGLLQLLGAFERRSWELKPILRRGDPRKVILREGAGRKADLIVLGTHGRTGLSRSMLGSVAEWIVRAAECDVLVARPSR